MDAVLCEVVSSLKVSYGCKFFKSNRVYVVCYDTEVHMIKLETCIKVSVCEMLFVLIILPIF